MRNGKTMLVVGALALFGCGDDTAPEQVGEATAAITLAPRDARCIVITTMGGTTVTKQFNVSPTGNAVFNLTGLPVGSATMTAQAYGVQCSSITGQQPTYVSDPITVTIAAGAPVMVTFQMRPNGTTGGGSVSINFPTPRGMVTEYPINVPASSLQFLTAGPDGNVWFTDWNGRIGLMYPWGSTTYFTVNSGGQGITTGPDGYIWYAGSANNRIGRITTTGSFAEFTVPTANAFPLHVAAGPDGNVWFTEQNAGKIGRANPATGTITEFTIPTASSNPSGIVGGPDGNVWFTERQTHKIGRITPSGTVTEFALASGAFPTSITLGPDGNLWFTEQGLHKIAKMTTGGTVTEYATLTANSCPYAITPGPDGNIWFTEICSNTVSRSTTTGSMAVYAIPTLSSTPLSIAAGADGNLWISEASIGKIGRLTP